MIELQPRLKSFLLALTSAFLTATAPQNTQAQAATRSPAPQLQRCQGVRGTACAAFYAQKLQDVPQLKVFSASCPINKDHGAPCGLGVCNGDTGACDCPAGVGGLDCGSEDPRPCTNTYRSNRSSSTPASHIGANKRDLGWRQPGWTPSRCAGVCDDSTGTCFCDGPQNGRVPALPGSAPGSPPIRPGRLLLGNCQRLTTDDAGRPLQWGGPGGVHYEDIYGAQGWCTVDVPRVRCSCDLDGYDGLLCEAVTETVCPNQCSGHGTCHRGFCKCFPGWFGLDCARLSDPAALYPPAAAAGAAGKKPSQEAAGAATAAGTAAAAGQAVQAASASTDSSSSDAAASTVDSIASAEAERQQQQQQPAAAPDDAAPDSAVTAAIQPPHITFLAARPHLAKLVVDHWGLIAKPPNPAPAGPHTPALAGPAAAAASASASAGGGSSGSPATAVAAAAAAGAGAQQQRKQQEPPAVPLLYFTPVSTGAAELGYYAGFEPGAFEASASDAAAAEAEPGQQQAAGAATTSHKALLAGDEPQTRVLLQKQHRQLTHSQQQHQQQIVQQQQQQQQQHKHHHQQQTVQQHQQQQETAHKQHHHLRQQQQQEAGAAKAGFVGATRTFLRTLLRHFWTGGGNQRPDLSLAPTQKVVTAAVHGWLSAGVGSSNGSSSDGSSSTGSSSNGSSDGNSSDGSSRSNLFEAGLTEAFEAAGVKMDKLSSERDQALLMQMVNRAVGVVPEGKVRRPRIFVYDMPSRFVSRLLQYRHSKQTCTWRVFSKTNFTLFTTSTAKNSWQYPLESHLHELMLQSPHRTLDPSEADFFYVPVYAACMMEAVAGWADAPWWHLYSKSHVKQGVLMYQDALDWVRTTYPYWNASGGADHIWLFAHDEGACWAPTEIFNASIILTQWGRLGQLVLAAGQSSKYGPVMDSWTSKWAQNWNKWHPSSADPLGLPGREFQELITHHPCYTPGKDLVLPTFRPPTMYKASPYMGADARRSRDILVLLRGDMGTGRRAPIRQQLASLAASGDWRRRYNAWIGTPEQLPGQQSQLLARSRYCLVVPIDGWSGGFEDAVLHGCIPVVVQLGAGLAQPFSSFLALSSGVLSIRASELPELPLTLAAIPPAVEDKLRAAVGTWWHRMAWSSHPFVAAQAAAVVAENMKQHPWVAEGLEQQQLQQQAALQSMGGPKDAAGATAAAAPDEGLLLPTLPPSSVAATGEESGSMDGEGSRAGPNSLEAGVVGSNSSSDTNSSSSSSDTNSSSSTGTAADAGAGGAAAAELELSETEQVAKLFETRVWQPDAPVDDAFTTLMQWLYWRMQHEPGRAGNSGGSRTRRKHTRPRSTGAGDPAATVTD